MGIGDWGLGIGDWAQSPIPNPQSPIPINIKKYIKYIYKKNYIFILLIHYSIFNLYYTPFYIFHQIQKCLYFKLLS